MAFAVKSKAAKYKFGVEVPRDVKHALKLDRLNGNALWRDAINKELEQLSDYKTFILPADPNFDWSSYKPRPYHIVFDVKFDLRRKARLVAGGNFTDTPDKEEIYSGVVGMDVVYLGFTVAAIQGLECCVGDVGNAFLYGKTREKVYITAGSEFGPELEGKDLVIDKGLYGLYTSAARYHEVMSAELCKLGFRPSKVDFDLWMQKNDSNGYDYLATYVDDICVWAEDPMAILMQLKQKFIMKGVGKPDYYLGGDVLETPSDGEWHKEGINTAMSARTYVRQALDKLGQLTGKEEFTKASTPMSELYHPELDDSEYLSNRQHGHYRAIVGCLNWLVTLGRIDIAYVTNTLARFSMAPRIGHLATAYRVLGYLRTHQEEEIKIDPRPFDYSSLEDGVKEFRTWEEFYPDACEDIPSDAPDATRSAQISVYVDADHAHDVVTRRSVTGIVLFINQTPVRWVSKRQATVETSTYGSEMVAACMATDLVMEYRTSLRLLGIKIEGPSWMFGDNMSVILSTTMPSSSLKKKHLSIAYHRVREMIACKAIQFLHVESEYNYADILTKPLPKAVHERLTQRLLRRKRPSEQPLIVEKPLLEQKVKTASDSSA